MRIIIHGYGRSGTTVLQRILNSCSDVWITNEFLLYDMPFGHVLHSGRDIKTAENYFRSLLIKDAWNTTKEHFPEYPPTLNRTTFVNDCLNNLVEDTPIGRILAVEKVLYSNIENFGDKLLTPYVLNDLREVGLAYKLIYITRDGRSAALSQKRYGFEHGNYVNSWIKSANFINSIKNQDKDNFLHVRLEDLSSNPKLVLSCLSTFLCLDYSELENGYSKNFNKDLIGTYDFSQLTITEEFKQALGLWGYNY